MRIAIVFAFIAWILFSSSAPVFAQENDIGQSLIHPASPFYFLKGIRENLELKFAGTDHIRIFRQLEFATRRLRETKALIPENEEQIPAILERYSLHLRSLPEKISKNDQALARIKDSLIVHLEVLQKIYDKVSNINAKRAIRLAMYRLIQRADIPDYARISICNLFAKEASSSALNQTEKVVLEERAVKCFQKPAI